VNVATARRTDRRAAARRIEYLLIECVTPELDAGRYPVKRIVGDTISVGADILKEGHDHVAARVLYQAPGEKEWLSVPMTYDVDTDRWTAEFVVDRIGAWTFTIEAWTDRFGTWRSGLEKKIAAGQDVSLDLLDGARMARTAAKSAKGPTRASLMLTAKALEDRRESMLEHRETRALDDDFCALMEEHFRPNDITRYRRDLTVVVDRERARFSSWYEVFPRSETEHAAPARHGTFVDATARLTRIAELGFDVVYLPPIHPIGRTHRKGKNNALEAQPDDVGSPWAIGNEHGGHTAIEPALGTFDDFDLFVARANELGMEIALDYALQCSPDHPWVTEHPDWFTMRADGSIAYAENPPKKYQDIYPINFWCDDRRNLWDACRDVLLFWIGHGVKIFRCDNPHTKPFAFWEWVIREVQSRYPEVIFFSEAFTRPKRMKALAKIGFTSSYTYFTWKNEPWSIRQYFEELAQTRTADFFRGVLFANTPDILNEYLVKGGRPAFRGRLLLAGTLLPSYGIYSGFELCENEPLKEGSEEYLNSEKYELRPRCYDAPGNINADIKRLNAIRNAHKALQLYDNLSFHDSENEQVLFYMKAAPQRRGSRVEGRGTNDRERRPQSGNILVAVNTNPHGVEETMVHVPLGDLGIGEDEPFVVEDLLTGAKYTWRGARNYVRLDPAVEPGHLLLVHPSTLDPQPSTLAL
jgi:starch synthase (maltosyl-transferring)